jgi:hypothetical protein
MKHLLCFFILILIIILILVLRGYRETFTNDTKKIACCFLIYDKINNEELWYNFFKNIDKNKYNIYIHYKENKPLKYFEEYKLKETIDTCWGCLSIVQAQNLLLKHALKDDKNQHFIWLSDSCIPLKSFDFIYNFLDINKSYFNIAPDNQVFPRANNLLKFIKKENIKKASMPSIINKKHSKLFVDNETNINKWFKNVGSVDENVYITLLHHFNLQNELVLTPNLSANAIIFTGWSDMKNYKNFNESIKKGQPNNYSFICKEELDYLSQSKSLFGRKFIDGCGGLNTLTKCVYVFWTGTNKMSEPRKKCLDSIKKNIGVKVILITHNNLDTYILKDSPLHKSYKYLSEVHKSDYLRTYFMHHYGGGYTDVKNTTQDWNPYFDNLKNSNKWVNGYQEIKGGSASNNSDIQKNYKKLIGNGIYIFKPNPPFSYEWFNKLNSILDKKYEALKKNPAKDHRDITNKKLKDNSISKYPLSWAEILGSIFHDIQYKYKDKCLYDLPLINTSNYDVFI